MYLQLKGWYMKNTQNDINVLIVDDSKLSCMILKKMIEALPNMKVSAVFDNAEDSIAFMSENDVDLVLMDIGLPYMNGVEASCIIKDINPEVKVVLFAADNYKSEILSSLYANADAYLLKDIPQKKFSKVINLVLSGNSWIDFRIQHSIFNYINSLPEVDYIKFKSMLNPKETSLIKMIIRGFNKYEVTNGLEIGLCDLSGYVHSIFDKLAKTEKVINAVKEFNYGFIEAKCL